MRVWMREVYVTNSSRLASFSSVTHSSWSEKAMALGAYSRVWPHLQGVKSVNN